MARQAVKRVRAATPPSPKTTRPTARSRRPADGAKPALQHGARTFDAFPDRIDIRDWFYQPRLAPLPDRIVNTDRVPFILDQGRDGACTGFALAAVINFLLGERNLKKSVSPRMLYDMARRYDEWPGEDYDGSSARGAMKGWVRHGVCPEKMWSADRHGPQHLTPEIAKEARGVPGGAFYRVMHREVRDMHAALAETGILYCTLMVHDGWFEPGPEGLKVTFHEEGTIKTIDLPIIKRVGPAKSGHAVAIVGYTAEGFIVQNSWGPDWGKGGFALLPYEDYMLHATDVWVAQLGVPVEADLWEAQQLTDSTAGLHRAAPLIPLADIRPYVIDVGNHGELSMNGDYWTTPQDVARLVAEIIPERTKTWKKRRVMLYMHGGLNDEIATARRIVAYRDVMLANEIYPVHIMWETGFMQAIRSMIEDVFVDPSDRAGGPVAEWLRKTREHLVEAKDWTFEITASLPCTALWDEMKENGRLASGHPRKKGAMQILAACFEKAVGAMTAADKERWELHVVGHSAGSIFCAYALEHLLGAALKPTSIQFMAPAITTQLFKELMLPQIEDGSCPRPDLYVLSDLGERDDDVGPYGKSLLYLVSNAFEGNRDTPLLGMQKFVDPAAAGPGGKPVDPAIAALFKGRLIVAGAGPLGGLETASETHGGFDNDRKTMNSVMRRILGRDPPRPFGDRDLQF